MVWRGQATPSDSKKTKKSKANCSRARLKSSLRTLESCPNNVADWRATRFIAGTMQNQNAKLVANRQQQQKPNNNNDENRKKAFSKHSLELFARHVPSEQDGEREGDRERGICVTM